MAQSTARTRSLLFLLPLLLAACGAPAAAPATPAPRSPTALPTAGPTPVAGLTADQVATLSSLEQVDGYPLYTMRYAGDYDLLPPPPAGTAGPASSPGWACSLFAALGDAQGMLYGRNFDWDYSPALLLYTAPADGYASVSMVDIAYLGFVGTQARELLDLPLEERVPLLYAPFLAFDGMNAAGLAVGMAAVPESAMPFDPNRETLDSVAIIREMLDHAASVDEAVAILGQYNIDWGSGPPVHYLVADRSGRATVAEFYEGRIVTFPNEAAWHGATNFLLAEAGAQAEGQCWRYDRISARLAEAQGRLAGEEAMALLESVSQEGTQWSVVYGMSTGKVMVSVGRQYERVYDLPPLAIRR